MYRNRQYSYFIIGVKFHYHPYTHTHTYTPALPLISHICAAHTFLDRNNVTQHTTYTYIVIINKRCYVIMCVRGGEGLLSWLSLERIYLYEADLSLLRMRRIRVIDTSTSNEYVITNVPDTILIMHAPERTWNDHHTVSYVCYVNHNLWT